MRNIFLEKSYTKSGGETIPRIFSKKSKLSVSLDQQSEINIQIVVHQNILKLRDLKLSFILYKAFSNNKKTSGTSLPASFSA